MIVSHSLSNNCAKNYCGPSSGLRAITVVSCKEVSFATILNMACLQLAIHAVVHLFYVSTVTTSYLLSFYPPVSQLQLHFSETELF
jgi:hypothetical protein